MMVHTTRTKVNIGQQLIKENNMSEHEQPQTQEPTIYDRLAQIEYRLARIEAVIFPQFNQQAGAGQKQIASDTRRVETGMGPLLNTGSDFV